jgi:HK97 family phage major capsid protein
MPSAFELKGMKEKRAKIRAQIAKLAETLQKEERGLTPDEQSTFDKLKQDLAAIGQQISQAQADVTAIEAALAQDAADATEDSQDGGADDPGAADMQANSRPVPGKQNRSGQGGGDGGRLITKVKPGDLGLAFRAWARRQYQRKVTRDQKEACERLNLDPRQKWFTIPLQKRDQSVGTTSAGGYTVAQEFSYKLDRALKAFSNVRGVCAQFNTATGADMPYPTLDDTSNVGELLAENTNGIAPTDLTFSSVTFKGYKYSTRGLLVSNELLNDEAVDLESMIADALGERLGRIQGTHFTTGDNSSKPQGIVIAAGTGVTAASTTTFTAAELISLFFKVDPAYRESKSFGWMMNDAVLAFVAGLTDSTGRPLFQQSYREGAPDMVLGKPVYTNQFMDSAFTTGKKLVLCGDFSKYMIRDVGGVRMRRLEERYAEKDQVGFIGFLRSDGRAINTAALKLLVLA